MIINLLSLLQMPRKRVASEGDFPVPDKLQCTSAPDNATTSISQLIAASDMHHVPLPLSSNSLSTKSSVVVTDNNGPVSASLSLSSQVSALPGEAIYGSTALNIATHDASAVARPRNHQVSLATRPINSSQPLFPDSGLYTVTNAGADQQQVQPSIDILAEASQLILPLTHGITDTVNAIVTVPSVSQSATSVSQTFHVNSAHVSASQSQSSSRGMLAVSRHSSASLVANNSKVVNNIPKPATSVAVPMQQMAYYQQPCYFLPVRSIQSSVSQSTSACSSATGVDFVPPANMDPRVLAAYRPAHVSVNTNDNIIQSVPVSTSAVSQGSQPHVINTSSVASTPGVTSRSQYRVDRSTNAQGKMISDLQKSVQQLQDTVSLNQQRTTEVLRMLTDRLMGSQNAGTSGVGAPNLGAATTNISQQETQTQGIDNSASVGLALNGSLASGSVSYPTAPQHTTQRVAPQQQGDVSQLPSIDFSKVSVPVTLPVQTATSAAPSLPAHPQPSTSGLGGVLNGHIAQLLEGAGIATAPSQPPTDLSNISNVQAGQILSALTRPVEPRQVVTAGLPLGSTVDPKIKAKIWANQYVEFEDILFGDTRSKYTLKTDTEGEFRIVQFDRKITTIGQWSQAFDVFVSVYIQKASFVSHLPELLTYGREIKKMAERNMNFLMYDDLFRRDRARLQNPYSWAAFREDLYHEATFNKDSSSSKASAVKVTASSAPSSTPNSQKKSVYIPRGFCFSFHSNGQSCDEGSACRYQHLCFRCKKGDHPQYQCRSSKSKKGGDKFPPKGDKDKGSNSGKQ